MSPPWVPSVFLAEEGIKELFVLIALDGDAVAVVDGEVEEVAFGNDAFTFMANYTQKRNACTKTSLSHSFSVFISELLGLFRTCNHTNA